MEFSRDALEDLFLVPQKFFSIQRQFLKEHKITKFLQYSKEPFVEQSMIFFMESIKNLNF